MIHEALIITSQYSNNETIKKEMIKKETIKKETALGTLTDWFILELTLSMLLISLGRIYTWNDAPSPKFGLTFSGLHGDSE